MRYVGLLALLLAPSFGCGEYAKNRYAGLDVITVGSQSGIGYRVRYLHPPWEKVASDPLVTGKSTAVSIGGDANVAPIEPATGAVLEIDRSSVKPAGSNVVSYPKYRLEAGLVRCDASMLAGADVCATRLAAHENGLLAATDQTGFFGPGGRRTTNDEGQAYVEILTRNLDSYRYRRIAYFETGVRDLAVRVAIEANPSLSDSEVTHMIDAVEVLRGEPAPLGDAGAGDDAAIDAGST